MKKLVVLLISICALISCEPPKKIDKGFIVSAIEENFILEVDGNDVYMNTDGKKVNKNFDFVGVLDIGVNKLAVSSCGNWGYSFLGIMNGKKVRAIAADEMVAYHEMGSEQYPTDMTSVTYFNCTINYNWDDDDNTVPSGRGKVDAWGPGWQGKRLGYCINDNPPHCDQSGYIIDGGI